MPCVRQPVFFISLRQMQLNVKHLACTDFSINKLYN